MEKNDTGCQSPPDAPILCVNNCGFFGTAATGNMCSKCHKEMMLKEEQAKLAASSIESIVNGGNSIATKEKEVAVPSPSSGVPSGSVGSEVVLSTEASCESTAQNEDNEKPKQGPSRCTTCRKRVGLTGFNCRCGNTFCSVHRYSDKHDCPFDYRSNARDAIAKANPVVKAQKLDKI